MLRKYSRRRLGKVFPGPVDGKLDYRYMGTSALLKINTEDNCGM
jgi:hypothetical protein